MSQTHTSISSSIQPEDNVSPTNHRFHVIPSPTGHQAQVPPSFIILSPWSNATPKHMERYIRGYRTLYPSSRIVILQSNSKPNPSQRTLDCETMNTSDLLDTLKPVNPESENLLLHLFGNSGAATGCHLLRSYQQRNSRPLNLRTMILDTAPSISTQLYQDLCTSLRILHPLSPLLVLMSITLHIFTSICSIFSTITEDTKARDVRRDLNDKNLVKQDTYICYVLASSGTLFSWRNAETQSREEMQRKEWDVDRKKVGSGGERWCGDQERYWMGVEDAWERRT